MSCACENQRLGREIDRIRRLAKAMAVMEGKLVVIYRLPDGTYGFRCAGEEIEYPITEYITPY